ncbi:hypothetical protein HW115_11250 [Verrucomicrobiaceae bacterium N1E253]|uniref:SLA1 homology domain-containing protein n=1 Tax=Oceaniferula marina TaxID=2748318 RepID=A0A851GEK5_9BACT|nr:SHD1 domain-containing protein [Oceaniferula marina]NWK56188.1 hypothetical protein [Oceaniferula marina]
MKRHTSIRTLILAGILGIHAPSALAELHTFTNTEGKTIQAEITEVSSGKVKLKLSNGKNYTVPFAKLSEADQTYIKEWHEKNKGMPKPSHFRLEIDRKSSRVREDKDKSKNSNTRTSKRNISYSFELSYSKTPPVEDVSVSYRIIKRSTYRGDDAGEPEFKAITGEEHIDTLDSKTPAEWQSKEVLCEDSSTKSKTSSKSKKETVLGMLAVVSVGDKELFRQYEPPNFEKELKELEEEHPELKPKAKKETKAPKKKKKAKGNNKEKEENNKDEKKDDPKK